MNDALRKKANEVYQAEMQRLQGVTKPKSPIADARMASAPQQFLGIGGGSFCADAPKTLKLVESEIDQFSMFIPDKYEHPIIAMLKVFEMILPEFCGAEDTSGAAATGGAPAGGGRRGG